MLFLSLLAALCAGSTAMTAQFADVQTAADFSLSAFYDDAAAATTFTLSSAALDAQYGWIGVGTGDEMSGSNIVVSWVNSDSSVTVSNRFAGGHFEPSADPSRLTLPAIVRNDSATMTSASGAMVTWTQPGFPAANSDRSKVSMIWAVNPSDRPSGPSPAATIAKHRDHGFFSFDLTKLAATDGFASMPGMSMGMPGMGMGMPGMKAKGSDDGDDDAGPAMRKMNKYNRIIWAHFFFMIAGWLVLLPAGIGIGRFGRLRFRWFPWHRVVQLVGLLLVIIGMFLGFVSQWATGGQNFAERHHKLGFALVVLLVFQAALGQFGHVFRARTGIRAQNFLHILLGLTLIPLATYNMDLGFAMWVWRTGNGPRDVLYTWLGLLGAAYVLGVIFLLPKEIRADKEKRALPLANGHHPIGQPEKEHLQEYPQQNAEHDQQRQQEQQQAQEQEHEDLARQREMLQFAAACIL